MSAYTQSYQQPAASSAIAKLIRDNVLRVGVVLVGMTLFIAAAEARTPINELDLTNLPDVVSKIANQTDAQVVKSAYQPMFAPLHRADQDYQAKAAPQNLLNSPFSRFVADKVN